ncbi:MAG: LytR family transcriptional regulator [Clostridiales bacterium]|nr:LytR family transcriptional regulator [Clostridiales bacterium]
MKKIISALALMLCLVLVCACAMGEITVTKRDMVLNRNLDKNVNNILVLMQDGGVTDTLMIASVNSRTGRSVMTQIECDTLVNLPEVGEVALGEVYALGAPKSRGLLVARTVNSLLDLNVSTYVAMELNTLPELVDEIGMLSTWLNEEEARILGTWAGDNALTSENVLTYVKIRLEEDYAEKNRSYMVFMDLLKQGLRSSGGANLMGLGKKLLDNMDTNLNALAAVTMLSSFQGGDDRRELFLFSDMSADEMRESFHREVYE